MKDSGRRVDVLEESVSSVAILTEKWRDVLKRLLVNCQMKCIIEDKNWSSQDLQCSEAFDETR